MPFAPIALALAGATSTARTFDAPIAANDARLTYVGRFDRRDPKGAVCQWSASEIRIGIDGTAVGVSLETKGQDFWQVVVDGKPTEVLELSGDAAPRRIELGRKGRHELRLVKRTEPFVGTTTFRGLTLPAGSRAYRIGPRKRHIEFIGDSITCGFGNEGKSATEKFLPSTENAYMSYASIAARAVNADPTLIAWSGRKMWPDNTTPSIYDRILPTQEEPKWSFDGPKPDAVVIHLATNDFGRENPEEKGWTDAYDAFIRRVWTKYPKAHVYACIGSMMSDSYPAGHKALSTVRGYLTRMVARMNDKRLHFVEMEQQKEFDGIGSGYHPSVKTDEKMAAVLVAALKRDVNLLQ